MKNTLFALSDFAIQSPAGSFTKLTDIAYGKGPKNTLDLYLPDNVKTAPIVVFIHGGRWFRGDKDQIALFDRINLLTSVGICIASINHTFSSQAVWPAQIDDVMLALDFVSDSAARYGYDASRMAVWGQSSGAHLALWAGLLSSDRPDLNLSAVVSWYAPSDLFNITKDRQKNNFPSEKESCSEPLPESLLIGMPVSDHKSRADAASPAIYTKTIETGKRLPNFLLTHGTADWVISPAQTERLFNALKAQGGCHVEKRVVEGGGHGGRLFKAEAAFTTRYLASQLDVPTLPVAR